MAVSKVDAANQIENQLPQANIANNAPFRNLIINGDMSVAQRSTSAVTASGSYDTVDRFRQWESTGGSYTSEQSTDVPSGQGFSNSMKLAVTTADTSLGASEYSIFAQYIEAQNLQYLNYGTNNAKTLTLSFWVKSSKTGTYSIMLDKNDATRYRYVKEYTINTADTWEKKIITIEPDSNIKASGGAITNDNGIGFQLFWNLAFGSNFTGATDATWFAQSDNDYYQTGNEVNWMDSTSNNFYITGVQLEAGDTASDFEFLPYDVTYHRCLRYFEMIGNGAEDADAIIATAGTYNDNVVEFHYTWYPKRAAPSIHQGSGTNYFRFYRNGANDDFNSVKIYIPNAKQGLIYSDDGISTADNTVGWIQLNSSSAYVGLNAEL